MRLTSKQARRIFYKHACISNGRSFSATRKFYVKIFNGYEVLFKGPYGDKLAFERDGSIRLFLYGPLSRDGREYLR